MVAQAALQQTAKWGPTQGIDLFPHPRPGTDAQLCQWLGLFLVHEPLDRDFSFSSSAFTITVFSQHRAGTLGGVCRGQDRAKEK